MKTLRSLAYGLILALVLYEAPALAQSPAMLELMKAMTNGGRFGNPRYTTTARFTCNTSQLGAKIENTTTATEQRCNGTAWVDAGSGAAIAAGTAITGGGANRVLFEDGSQNLATDADFTYASDVLTLGAAGAGTNATVWTKTHAGDSATKSFFGVTGTMPTMTAETNAVLFNITGAGSAAQTNNAVKILYNAGYTGASFNAGLRVENASVGTGSNLFADNAATYGIAGLTTGSVTGQAIGVLGWPSAGTVVTGYGVAGDATTVGTNRIGVAGFATGGTTNVGVWGRLSTTVASLVTAAGLFDNGTDASPILIAQDNGTAVFTIADGGAENFVSTAASVSTMTSVKYGGAKANITEASAQAIVKVTLPSSGMFGAWVTYTVTDDATDFIARNGSIQIQGVNKAGTTTCTIAAARDTEAEDGSSAAVSGGALTLTYTWTNVANSTACDLSLNAASSAGANTYDIKYTLLVTGTAGLTVTAQ